MKINAFVPDAVSADKVKEIREKHGYGMMEARHILTNRNIKVAFETLRSEGSLEEKVEWLLDRYGEKINNG
jgi:translation elongation factor EF-Ts